jgi:hypothetical protein
MMIQCPDNKIATFFSVQYPFFSGVYTPSSRDHVGVSPKLIDLPVLLWSS